MSIYKILWLNYKHSTSGAWVAIPEHALAGTVDQTENPILILSDKCNTDNIQSSKIIEKNSSYFITHHDGTRIFVPTGNTMLHGTS